MKKICFAFLLSTAPLYAIESQSQPDPVNFTVNDLGAGMYSYQSPNAIPNNAAVYIQNFYTDIQGMAVERNGSIQLESTVLGGTKAVTGLWTFFDSNGTEWIIGYSSNTFYKKQPSTTFTAFGPLTTTTNQPFATVNLGKIWFVDGADSLWSFDGTSTATVASAPLGRYITSWRNRLAIGNIAGSQSTVQFSKDGDGTTWTVAAGDSDPFSIQVGGANDGYPINCLYGMFQDTLIIGRKFDLWGMYGFTQADEQTRKITSEIGCIQNGTMRETDGDLIWLSNRGLEKMNGSVIQLISDPVRDITDTLVKNTANLRFNTQTNKSDFDAGTITPTGNLSTSISPGNVMLSTMATQILADNTAANFGLGSLVGFSTTSTTLGNLVYVKLTTATVYSCTTGSNLQGVKCACGFSQAFYLPYDFILSSTTFLLSRTAAVPGDATLTLTNYNSGATIATLGTVTMSAVTTSAAGANVTVVNTPVSLTGGTTYLLTLQSSIVTCTTLVPGICGGAADKFFYYYYTNSPCSTNIGATTETNFSITGFNNISTATITSRTYDVGVTTQNWLWNWGAINSVKSLTGGATINYQTQSSADNSSFDSLVSVAENAITTSTVRRYIRYKATVTSPQTSATMYISSISFSAGPFISTTGLFTSQLMSIGNLITSWAPISIADTQSTGTITYQFGSTNTASVASISNWTNITQGGTPVVSTNPYAAFRATFTPTNYAANLALGSFQTSWNEGSNPANTSWTWDRRYWMSFTTNTASNPSLDTILVYQRNKTFTLLKGINASSFTRWRDGLYFGDSTATGLVYQYDIGAADNGSNINSLIITKSYDLDHAFRDKDFRKAYVGFEGATLNTGSFSLNYDMDRSGNSYSLGTAALNESTGLIEAKFPFALGTNPTQGREVQYTISKSGADSRLKLYEIRSLFYLKEPF